MESFGLINYGCDDCLFGESNLISIIWNLTSLASKDTVNFVAIRRDRTLPVAIHNLFSAVIAFVKERTTRLTPIHATREWTGSLS
jgi:hypothetical protein